MEISVAGQAGVFGGALLLGMAVGLAYDLLRIPRACLPIRLLGGVLDALFWVAVTAALFVYAVTAGGGEVRIFMAAALFGGAVLYFRVFSPWVRRLTGLIVRAVRVLWRGITLPFVRTAAVLKKFKEKIKNSFSSYRKRYKIKQISGEEEAAARRKADGEGSDRNGGS